MGKREIVCGVKRRRLQRRVTVALEKDNDCRDEQWLRRRVAVIEENGWL